MKSFQNNYIFRLFHPKAVIFGIALFNFLWVYWESLSGYLGGVSLPWYLDKEFAYTPQLFLLISASLLFFNFRLGYIFSIITSGYYIVSWGSIFYLWFSRGNTIYDLVKSINNQLEDYNLLKAFESQIIIAAIIFTLSVYYLIKSFKINKAKKLA